MERGLLGAFGEADASNNHGKQKTVQGNDLPTIQSRSSMTAKGTPKHLLISSRRYPVEQFVCLAVGRADGRPLRRGQSIHRLLWLSMRRRSQQCSGKSNAWDLGPTLTYKSRRYLDFYLWRRHIGHRRWSRDWQRRGRRPRVACKTNCSRFGNCSNRPVPSDLQIGLVVIFRYRQGH